MTWLSCAFFFFFREQPSLKKRRHSALAVVSISVCLGKFLATSYLDKLVVLFGTAGSVLKWNLFFANPQPQRNSSLSPVAPSAVPAS
jgi:hypothetical protein